MWRTVLVLPLTIVALLAVVLELAAVVATNDFVVLRPRLVLRRRIVLAVGLTLTATPLIALMLATVPVILGATILWLIGKRLRTDTHTQQTNTGQTPDARLHAFPHCGY